MAEPNKRYPLGQDIIRVIKDYTNNAVTKKGHTYFTSADIFEGCVRLFKIDESANSAPPAQEALYNKIKPILQKYGITSTSYDEAYKTIYPVGTPIANTSEVTPREDVDAIFARLHQLAQNKKRQADIQDLMFELFSDVTYPLFSVFQQLSDLNGIKYDEAIDANIDEDKLPPLRFDVNLLYSDMQRILVRSDIGAIKSLEDKGLKSYLTNINKYVDSKDINVIGCDREVQALAISLAGRTKKSAVLLGPAGTGKTSIVYKLAKTINEGTCPDILKDKIIYELHCDAVVAGSMYRGQAEERFLTIFEAVAKVPNVILFIDEIHTIGKAGGNDGGDMTAANIMKPFLSRGELSVIGATTNDEYNKHLAQDKAIVRRFKKVLVNEPSKEETLEIMRGVNPTNIEFFGRELHDELLEKVYTLSTQYNLDTYNPDKALTLLESAYAYASVSRNKGKEVTIEDMMLALSLEYNILVTDTKTQDTINAMHSKLLGQDKPLDEVGKYLKMIDLNLVDAEKPKATLLFAGPTGTGKTETAKIIAKNFTGSEKNLITIECSTLQSESSASVITGSNPGYIGYDEGSSLLNEVKQKPNSVVLFDEIEKAHPTVFKTLLNILDEGKLKDNKGNEVSFRNTIVIFTTNLGFGVSNHTAKGIMATTTNSQNAVLEINKHFSPEFIGRLDEVIVYNRLTKAVSKELIERYRKKYAKLSETDIQFLPKDFTAIKKVSNIEQLGARNLDHAVKIQYFRALQRSKDEEKTKESVVVE